MSITNGNRGPGTAGPRIDDPRVIRTRAAVAAAARGLFLRHGYGGTTMEEIAAEAGVTKRTLYNNYADKRALFLEIVARVTAYADDFVTALRGELDRIDSANLHRALDELGCRLARGIVRDEVVAIRRLLIGEARDFPDLAADYFGRAPARVIDAMASGFRRLHRKRLLNVPDARRAAAQFAYLVAGELLDRAVMTGTVPPDREIAGAAREGVTTFLARYDSASPTTRRRAR